MQLIMYGILFDMIVYPAVQLRDKQITYIYYG